MSLAPFGRIRFLVTGARGATFADVARAAGSFGSFPDDTDNDVNQKFADYAIQKNPGFKGDRGDTGPADNTYTSYTAMQASDPTRASARLVGDTDNPPRPDGPYNNPTHTLGGWQPQAATGIVTALPTSNTTLDVQTVTNVIVSVERFAAKKVGDDWGPAIQAAMDYLASIGGGRVTFARKGFSNFYATSKLYWRQNVYLDGGACGGQQAEGTWLRPISNIDGFLIDTDNTQPVACGLIGLCIAVLDGSTSMTGGVRVANGVKFIMMWAQVSGAGRQAAVINGGICQIKECGLSGCQNQSLFNGVQAGVLTISGADNWVCENEIAGSAQAQPSAAYFQGGNIAAFRAENLGVSLIQGNVFEVGDSGCNHWGSDNRYIGNRYDTNAGFGLFLCGSNNVSLGEYFGRNNFRSDKKPDGSDNPLFDHIYAPPGQSSGNHIISPHFYNSPRSDGTWSAVRYVVNDQTGGGRNPNRYIHPGTSMTGAFDGADRPNYLSGFWNLATSNDGGPTVTLADSADVRLFFDTPSAQVATPSVLNMTRVSITDGYNTTTTVTNFAESFPGQILRVQVGNSPLTNSPRFDLRGKGPITNAYITLVNRGGNGNAAVWTLIGGLF